MQYDDRGPRRKKRIDPNGGHFAVRQLPAEILSHYKKAGTLQKVTRVEFSHVGAIPHVTITCGSIIDVWVWQYQGPGKQLPKQIFRTYRQLNRLQYIKTVTCHMDNGSPAVIVDTGDKRETWVWDKDGNGSSGSSGSGKTWSAWILDTTDFYGEESDMKMYDYSPWVKIRSEHI